MRGHRVVYPRDLEAHVPPGTVSILAPIDWAHAQGYPTGRDASGRACLWLPEGVSVGAFVAEWVLAGTPGYDADPIDPTDDVWPVGPGEA